ncbi:MAG: hypothetical protein FD180_747 [Planctomycetota bacterium]|nr:MAG: hypothetical protein FD180_747 [Planctomycetota bacterium]
MGFSSNSYYLLRSKSELKSTLGSEEDHYIENLSLPSVLQMATNTDSNAGWDLAAVKLKLLAKIVAKCPESTVRSLFPGRITVLGFDRYWSLEPLNGLFDVDDLADVSKEAFRRLSAEGTADPPDFERWLDLYRG